MVMRIDTNLVLRNDSKPRGEGWWEWSVWVDAPPEELQNVESVTYRLHPTFPDPIRTVRDLSTKFRLESSGWGEFMIVAEARTKDDRVVRLEHWLELRDPSEKGSAALAARRKGPTVFVSHSITDNSVVYALRKALEGHGVRVWTEQNLESGDDVASEIRDNAKTADVTVAVVSDPPSPWVEQEAQLAMSAGRTVLPVLVGNAQIPSSLANLARLEIPDRGKIEGLAGAVLARVKDSTTPEEA